MDRREFLRQSLQGSLGLYFASLCAPAAGQHKAPWSLPGGALNPVSTFLKDYQVPPGALDPTLSQSLTFDVLQWNTGKRRQDVSVSAIGTLNVKREVGIEGGLVRYAVRQDLDSGERMQSTVLCANDKWRTVSRWESQHVLDASEGDLSGYALVREQGRRRDSTLKLTRDGAKLTQSCSSLLLCRWGLLDAGAAFSDLAEQTQPFALLQEPTGVRMDQRMRPAEASTHEPIGSPEIRAYLQSGPACLPTHWVFDQQNRPLFVTTFLLSLALREVS